jgi:hypothetical protein
VRIHNGGVWTGVEFRARRQGNVRKSEKGSLGQMMKKKNLREEIQQNTGQVEEAITEC